MSQVEIPYIATAREDTGVYNAKLGVWLFLASEVMLFGALFSSYVLLRTHAATWPHAASVLNVPLATLNTMVLIASSVTMVMAWASLMMNKFGRYRLFMGLTILCGIAFLVVKTIEYGHHIREGMYLSEDTFHAIYFTMTGLHGLHVLGGIIVNAYLSGPGSRMCQSHP